MIVSSTQLGGFSLALASDTSYCSGLSNDPAISSVCEDSVGRYSYVSNDDEEVDSPGARGNLIMERPLTLDELDKLCSYSEGITVKTDTRGGAYASMCSMLSDDFDSVMLDSISDESDDETDCSVEELWYDQGSVAIGQTPSRSVAVRGKGRTLDGTGLRDLLIADVLSEAASSIDNSEYLQENLTSEDRWQTIDQTDKTAMAVPHQKAETTPPRKRIPIGNNDWRIVKRQSSTRGATKFDMMNSKIHAEIGLKMSKSVPAQKVMEAILSALSDGNEAFQFASQ